MRIESVLTAALIACGLTSPAAHAQSQDDAFRRDRNVGVRDRPRPEYDAPGMPAGGFRLFPEVGVYEEYNDNIFAADGDEEADLITRVQARARLRSQWSSHALNFEAGVESKFHAQFTQDDTTDWHVASSGKLDVVRGFSVTAGLRYDDQHEDRSSSPSVVQLAEPLAYRRAGAELEFVRTFNKLQISGRARATSFDYDDGELTDSTPVEEDDRDRVVYELGGRVDYAISPDTSFFVSVTGNSRDYDLDPPNPAASILRDSNGAEALFGVSFDLTHLIRGEVNVGYFLQDYDDPGASSTSGLTTRSSIEWYIDPLVTIHAAASRDVQDAGVTNAAGYLTTGIEAGVDYEFRRNIIFGLESGYSEDEYNAIDRNDRRSRFEARVDYAVSRNASISFEAGRYVQESTGLDLGRDYEIDRALIGIRLRR